MILNPTTHENAKCPAQWIRKAVYLTLCRCICKYCNICPHVYKCTCYVAVLYVHMFCSCAELLPVTSDKLQGKDLLTYLKKDVGVVASCTESW